MGSVIAAKFEAQSIDRSSEARRYIVSTKVDSFADSNNPSPPETLAQELVEDLAALEQLGLIEGDLNGKEDEESIR